jgi:hypothetical protein
MEQMTKLSMAFIGIFILIPVLITKSVNAQETDIHTAGSLRNLTPVKLQPNMDEDYLMSLSKTLKASMNGLVTANIIKSYKILKGEVANSQDFDLIPMTEIENLASMEPDPEKDKKMDELE